jgi:6-phosphogluconolactonase
MKIRRKIKLCRSFSELNVRVAETIIEILSQRSIKQNFISIVLSGGSTPRALYQLLAGAEYRNQITWDKLLVFFGDERCVPPNDPESNYKMAYDVLLSKLPIPEKNVFRLKGEIDPQKAAADYERAVKKVLGKAPRFDLVLLGMGADGHTASLFPGTAALHETKKLAAANYVDKLNACRLTLTLPAFNSARNVIFLVSGKDKAAAVRSVFSETALLPPPARLIEPAEGGLLWFLDKEAASLLDNTIIRNFS